jgi:hypothetical protein
MRDVLKQKEQVGVLEGACRPRRFRQALVASLRVRVDTVGSRDPTAGRLSIRASNHHHCKLKAATLRSEVSRIHGTATVTHATHDVYERLSRTASEAAKLA